MWVLPCPAHSQSVQPGRNSVPVFLFILTFAAAALWVSHYSVRLTDPHRLKVRGGGGGGLLITQRLYFIITRGGMAAARWVGAERYDATVTSTHSVLPSPLDLLMVLCPIRDALMMRWRRKARDETAIFMVGRGDGFHLRDCK